MHRLLRLRPRLIAALALSSTFVASAASAVDDPQWKLPPGFTIELVAGADLVRHPTMGCFDDRGRLYLCDGPGDNLPAAELLEQKPHHIRRLEDTDGDGRFDRATVFADGLVFPQGALWHDGAIYTASPPNIWKLVDTDDDGVCDERQILVSEFGFTGNAADIHGCFLGPDGRIYWCDGRHGHTFTDAEGRTLSKGLAARLFSCKPDGTDVQVFAGGGMDNPVEVAFTEEGEPIGTVAIYDNQPDRVDALIHWVYGGVYPYSEKVLGEFKKTGDLLPAIMRYGRVAPAGVLRYRSTAWGADYVDNFFHVQFNTHRLIRTQLTREGATFRGADEEFLVSDQNDVHLTDVIEDADGSLLVVDTGGWFRQGCPNSQIAKPEILGGVYRIRKTDAKPVDDPRGLKLKWSDASLEELVERLRDDRPAVRDRAGDALVAGAGSLVATNGRPFDEYLGYALAKNLDGPDEAKNRMLRRNAVWVWSRTGSPAARGGVAYTARADDDFSVQLAANRALSTMVATAVDPQEFGGAGIYGSPPAVYREAATVLGMMRDRGAVPSLLSKMDESHGDRFLEHALIYALIEINEAETYANYLTWARPNARRAALIALDQNDSPLLTRELVAALLDVPDAALQRAALGVMQRHPDWADGILDYLRKRLSSAPLAPPAPEKAPEANPFGNAPPPAVVSPADEADLLRDTILAYKADERVQRIVAEALADAVLPADQRSLLLEVIERSEFTPAALPKLWAERVAAALQSTDEVVVRQAITVVGRVGGDLFDDALFALGEDAARGEALRVAALAALGPRLPPLGPETFTMLMTRVTSARDALDRLAAADVIGNTPLDATQRPIVVAAVAQAGPLELPALLRAFVQAPAPHDDQPYSARDVLDPEMRLLLTALAKSPGAENVPTSLLEKLVAGRPDDVRALAEPIMKRINADIETQRARLTELLPQLAGGDRARGAIVFQMHKTACSSCHRVGTRGTPVGPDLTKVGQIRALPDIVESVLYPSASFVRNYESVAIETADGRVVIGVPGRETPEAVYVRTAQKEEVRVARADIETIAPSKLSIMPQGLDKVMTLEELRDLVAYLQSLK